MIKSTIFFVCLCHGIRMEKKSFDMNRQNGFCLRAPFELVVLFSLFLSPSLCVCVCLLKTMFKMHWPVESENIPHEIEYFNFEFEWIWVASVCIQHIENVCEWKHYVKIRKSPWIRIFFLFINEYTCTNDLTNKHVGRNTKIACNAIGRKYFSIVNR